MANLRKAFTARGLGREQGFTLLEALIASVVLGVGLLAAYRFNSTTIAFSAESNVRAYALTLAEGKLEDLRNFKNSAGFNGQFDLTIEGVGESDEFVYTSSVLTRSWDWAEGAFGDNPREVSVTVTWKDKLDETQTVTLSSIIWRNSPENGAKNLFLALNNSGNSVDGFGDSNGFTVKGAGEDGGTVRIKDGTDFEFELPVEEGGPDPADYWDVEFFGDIFFTDEGLSSVAITSVNAEHTYCDIVDSVTYEVGNTVLDEFGDVATSTAEMDVYENGVQVFDVYGAPIKYKNPVTTPADDTRYVTKYIEDGGVRTAVYYEASLIALEEGSGGFSYRCVILGVPDSIEIWTGTLTYAAAGNDGICTPANDSHSVDIIVDKLAIVEDAETLDVLGVVVMSTKGSCPKISK